MEYRVDKSLEIYGAIGILPDFFLKVSDESFDRMYNLCISNKHFEPSNDKEYILILLFCYDNDSHRFIKYFKDAIKLNYNIDCFFYYVRNKGMEIFDDKSMIDFLNDEIEKENPTAMYILAVIYEMKRDAINESRYCQLAMNHKYVPAIMKYCRSLDLPDEEIIRAYQINLDSPECIIGLAKHYWQRLQNYDEMMKLFTEAFENFPNYRLTIYKWLNQYIFDSPYSNITLQLKKGYILLSIRYNAVNQETIDYLGDILSQKEPLESELIDFILKVDLSQYKDIPVGLKLIQNLYQEKIDIIDLHYKYQPGQAGFNEAKRDFDEKIIFK